MTYGYKKLKDGSMVPYPIDTQLPQKISKNKLSNTDIDILKILIEHRLSEINKKPEETTDYFKPEILQQISKKLDTLYFS